MKEVRGIVKEVCAGTGRRVRASITPKKGTDLSAFAIPAVASDPREGLKRRRKWGKSWSGGSTRHGRRSGGDRSVSEQREKVVYDCNIHLQYLLNPDGSAGACVQAALRGCVELLVSHYVLDELREMPNRESPKSSVRRLIWLRAASRNGWRPPLSSTTFPRYSSIRLIQTIHTASTWRVRPVRSSSSAGMGTSWD